MPELPEEQRDLLDQIEDPYHSVNSQLEAHIEDDNENKIRRFLMPLLILFAIVLFTYFLTTAMV